MKGPPKEFKVVRTILHELHRLLLAALKKDRERLFGQAINPSEWFQILLSAPEYNWLKSLNSLLSDVDALFDSGKIGNEDLAIVRHELERFFFKEDGDVTSFNSHYRKLFQHNHEVMFSHGRLKEAFSELASAPVPANADEIRRSWHKIGASKRKLLN
jgi:hypothetical protein